MGIYNFKAQFVPMIEEDSKRHTIRAKRRHPDKPGNIMHLYTGLRQRGARLLKRRRCVKVEDILITVTESIYIESVCLDESERNGLAWRDGFRPPGSTEANPGPAFELMMQFWKGRLPFSGDLNHWESDDLAGKRK